MGTGKERRRCDATGGGKEGSEIAPHPARKLGLDELGCSGGPTRLEDVQASRSAGHWWADLTSGSSSVPDTASF